MNQLDERVAFDDKIAVGFSRAVTRQSFLRRVMTFGLVLGSATSAGVVWPRTANAATCSITDSSWGCYCNPNTTRCGSDRCCNGQPCNGAQWRCDYWANGVCWCSATCCLFGNVGFYSCCDGWKYGNYGGCGSGNTKCLCAQWHPGMSC